MRRVSSVVRKPSVNVVFSQLFTVFAIPGYLLIRATWFGADRLAR